MKAPNVTFAPLGDRALLIRFGDCISSSTNDRAVRAAQVLGRAQIEGVGEVNSTLVSVLMQYEPGVIDFQALTQQVRLAMAENSLDDVTIPFKKNNFKIDVIYGGDNGPDLADVAAQCAMDIQGFIAAHNDADLRVLATGFAPGFVYCGLHKAALHIPRRTKLHKKVPPGSIIFAAGQTAITASYVPTGWHVIGQTDFRNFNELATPPTKLTPGDNISFCSEVFA